MSKTNNNRRFPGESSQHRCDQAAGRRESAKERQELYNSLTPQQKIDKLDVRFGAGLGAAKERAKILALMQGGTKSKTVKKVEVANHEELAHATLPAEIMAEIDAINEESGMGKKKLKAKDRRVKDQSPNN